MDNYYKYKKWKFLYKNSLYFKQEGGNQHPSTKEEREAILKWEEEVPWEEWTKVTLPEKTKVLFLCDGDLPGYGRTLYYRECLIREKIDDSYYEVFFPDRGRDGLSRRQKGLLKSSLILPILSDIKDWNIEKQIYGYLMDEDERKQYNTSLELITKTRNLLSNQLESDYPEKSGEIAQKLIDIINKQDTVDKDVITWFLKKQSILSEYESLFTVPLDITYDEKYIPNKYTFYRIKNLLSINYFTKLKFECSLTDEEYTQIYNKISEIMDCKPEKFHELIAKYKLFVPYYMWSWPDPHTPVRKYDQRTKQLSWIKNLKKTLKNKLDTCEANGETSISKLIKDKMEILEMEGQVIFNEEYNCYILKIINGQLDTLKNMEYNTLSLAKPKDEAEDNYILYLFKNLLSDEFYNKLFGIKITNLFGSDSDSDIED